jgi:flavodoxin
MKTLIIFDSRFGNTEKIAQAISEAISGEIKMLRPKDANPAELDSVGLLVVGSPTWGGRPTSEMRRFLNKIPKNALNNVKVASFDTRDDSMLTKVFGKAAGRIAASLKKKGGTLMTPPEGFIVKGLQGPLVEGELERAAKWAKTIVVSK